jgi:hypothetical protein
LNTPTTASQRLGPGVLTDLVQVGHDLNYRRPRRATER